MSKIDIDKFVEHLVKWGALDANAVQSALCAQGLTWGDYTIQRIKEESPKKIYVDNANKVEPKFKKGDWIINRTNATIMQIVNNKDFYESVEIGGQRRTDTYNYIEWDFRLWTIKDAKDGDVLSWDDSKCIALFKNIYDEDSFNSHGFVGHYTNIFESRLSYHDIEGAHPATKAQRVLLFKKMKEAGYEWDAEKKELKKIEQKPTEIVKWSPQEESCICQLESLVKEQWRQAEKVHNSVNIKKMSELMFFLKTLNPNKKPQRIISAEAKEALYDKSTWSEEDEKNLYLTTTAVEQKYSGELFLGRKQKEIVCTGRNLLDWLYSLKERVQPNQWKPNKEQIETLEYYMLYLTDCKQKEILFGLYDQLKKLNSTNNN